MKILAVLCDKDEAVEIEKMLRHMEALSGGKQSSGEGCCWKDARCRRVQPALYFARQYVQLSE